MDTSWIDWCLLVTILQEGSPLLLLLLLHRSAMNFAMGERYDEWYERSESKEEEGRRRLLEDLAWVLSGPDSCDVAAYEVLVGPRG
jgi:hypothetical protein